MYLPLSGFRRSAVKCSSMSMSEAKIFLDTVCKWSWKQLTVDVFEEVCVSKQLLGLYALDGCMEFLLVMRPCVLCQHNNSCKVSFLFVAIYQQLDRLEDHISFGYS